MCARCLLDALSEIILLAVLPLKTTRNSRFKRFVRSMIKNIESNAILKKMKSKSRKGIIVFFAVMVGVSVGALIKYLKLDFNPACFKP